MNKAKNIFVYAVCGDDIYINQLNISLKFLKHFSKQEIIVVTDTERNSSRINHNHIIDIKTPKEYTHHQAAIYLKTGLYKFLDQGHNYCYLDSDVLALTKKVDDIFNHYKPPVCFAHDHIKTTSFSPYAINCGCLDQYDKKKAEYLKAVNAQNDFDEIFFNDKSRDLLKQLILARKEPFRNIPIIFRYAFQYLLPFSKRFRLSPQFILDKKKQEWQDKHKNYISFNFLPFFKDNTLSCNHLYIEIEKKFNIQNINQEWQHWNGGVFLFNDDSHNFLNTWHTMTLEIFKDNNWKTRDQGTLVATVWRLNLQNHNTLPQKFNFIADFYNLLTEYDEDKGFTDNHYKSIIQPNFIHYIHQFENKDWPVRKAAEIIYKRTLSDDSL